MKKKIYSTITYKNLDELAARLDSVQSMPNVKSVDVIIDKETGTKDKAYGKVLILITKKEDDNCKVTT